MIKSNKELIARQNAIQQWYEFFEKLNILMQDYTIDYEEYYNRQMVWCVKNWSKLLTWNNFEWNIWVSGYCTEFTAYWNENSTKRIMSNGSEIPSTYHDIYYCSSAKDQKWRWLPVVVKKADCWKYWSKQSFGQYANLFIDVASWTGNIVWDSDDKDLWDIFNGVNAIKDDNNIQELYLISHDWKNRLFLRRKAYNLEHEWYAQYRIQILRLRWFDAGEQHNFDITNGAWLYDWKIDTWACDTSMWFIWEGDSIWWAYAGYHLPKDVEDCWVDLTYWNTSIYTWNLSISPLWDSDLFRAEDSHQINSYMKILLVNSVFMPSVYNDSSIGSSITEFKVPIETTINMKDFYRE